MQEVKVGQVWSPRSGNKAGIEFTVSEVIVNSKRKASTEPAYIDGNQWLPVDFIEGHWNFIKDQVNYARN